MKIEIVGSTKNGDKNRQEVKSLEEAFKLLGVTEQDLSQKVEWRNITDYFFRGTKSYIRVVK